MKKVYNVKKNLFIYIKFFKSNRNSTIELRKL